MCEKSAIGLLLIIFFCQVSCQITATSDSSQSVSSVTEATCGIGSYACPTDQTPGSNGLPDSVNMPSTAAPEQTTVTLLETTVTPTTITQPGNTTEKSMPATTTKQQKVPSTTPLPTTNGTLTSKLPEDQNPGYAHSGTCACDLLARACDVNCCCDPDCTSFQRLSFSSCIVDGYPQYDNRFCYATKLVFLNNSEHILQQVQNGAFCIVRSNLAGSVLYPHKSVYFTTQEFIKHWERSHSQDWPEAPVSNIMLIPSEKPKTYTSAASIWVLKNSQIKSLDFPSSGISSACSIIKAVPYLLPWSSQCIRKIPETQAECDAVSSHLHHQIQSIVRSPPLVNLTELTSGKIAHCPANVCVPVKYLVCNGSSSQENYSLNDCQNISSERILFGFKSGMCYNVVKRLKLVLHHNGTAGIEHAEAYFWLSNTSSVEVQAVKPLHQSFSVEFLWIATNQTAIAPPSNTSASHALDSIFEAEQIPFSRSGNPGYILGKPVIAGYRVKQKRGINVSTNASVEKRNTPTESDKIELSHDSKQWLTLPGSGFHGMCDWSKAKRHLVTFGEDLHLSCGLTLSPRNTSSHSSCNSLRMRMLQLLLGDVSKLFQNGSDQSDWGRVIAVYGSANVSVPQDWIPLLLDSQSPFSILSQVSGSTGDTKIPMADDADRPVQTCENVPLGIQIRIMYGFVGTTSNPHSKILGASLRFSPLQDIGQACSFESCFRRNDSLNLRIVSTVKFIDVTSPAVTRFAEPPAIHIRLPPDFFYPFMSAGDSAGISLHNTPFILILCMVLFPLLHGTV